MEEWDNSPGEGGEGDFQRVGWRGGGVTQRQKNEEEERKRKANVAFTSYRKKRNSRKVTESTLTTP